MISNNTDYEPYDLINSVDGFVKWPTDITPPDGSANSNGAILGYVSNSQDGYILTKII